jgi:hypothetical protein
VPRLRTPRAAGPDTACSQEPPKGRSFSFPLSLSFLPFVASTPLPLASVVCRAARGRACGSSPPRSAPRFCARVFVARTSLPYSSERVLYLRRFLLSRCSLHFCLSTPISRSVMNVARRTRALAGGVLSVPSSRFSRVVTPQLRVWSIGRLLECACNVAVSFKLTARPRLSQQSLSVFALLFALSLLLLLLSFAFRTALTHAQSNTQGPRISHQHPHKHPPHPP